MQVYIFTLVAAIFDSVFIALVLLWMLLWTLAEEGSNIDNKTQELLIDRLIEVICITYTTHLILCVFVNSQATKVKTLLHPSHHALRRGMAPIVAPVSMP